MFLTGGALRNTPIRSQWADAPINDMLRTGGETVRRTKTTAPWDQYPRRAAAVLEQQLGEEALLFQPKRGKVGILNATAYFIWQQCDGTRTPRDIALAMAENYAGVDLQEAEKQIGPVLQDLHSSGMLVGAKVKGTASKNAG